MNGTPYGRPEDLEIGTLADGTEVLYLATTGENVVYSIELLPGGASTNVREFVTADTINAVTVVAVGTGPVSGLQQPDNLAVDTDGNIYIVEDETPGDIWFAHDPDHDGVANELALWASLSTVGAEPTGLYFVPHDPGVAYVSVQHPFSAAAVFNGNAEAGQIGDALVRIVPVPEPTGLSVTLLALAAITICSPRRPFVP